MANNIKPIFHCDAKYLASGVGIGQCPRRIFWHYLICVFPDANLRRQLVEYRLRWVPTQNTGGGHVHFMFFCVDFICI